MENTPKTKNSRPGRLKGVYPDGKTIRKLRLAKGWQQQKLANEAKVNLRTVERAEAGKNRMDPTWLGNIARALEVDTSRITVTDPTEEVMKVRVTHVHEQIRLSPT